MNKALSKSQTQNDTKAFKQFILMGFGQHVCPFKSMAINTLLFHRKKTKTKTGKQIFIKQYC